MGTVAGQQWSGGGGREVGRGDLSTRSARRPGRLPHLLFSRSLSTHTCGKPAKEEVRGQLACDSSGFRHTFLEECRGFVPGACTSPEP